MYARNDIHWQKHEKALKFLSFFCNNNSLCAAQYHHHNKNAIKIAYCYLVDSQTKIEHASKEKQNTRSSTPTYAYVYKLNAIETNIHALLLCTMYITFILHIIYSYDIAACHRQPCVISMGSSPISCSSFPFGFVCTTLECIMFTHN